MVRIRAYLLVLSMPLLLVIASLIWSIAVDNEQGVVGWIIFAAGMFLQLIFALVIACPRCGKSTYAIGPTWGFIGVASKPVPDTTCSNCGYDLRGGDPNIG